MSMNVLYKMVDVNIVALTLMVDFDANVPAANSYTRMVDDA